MPFEKKPIEEKMIVFSTTLKPEAYIRLKHESEKTKKPMSEILSAMILKHIAYYEYWETLLNVIGHKKEIRKKSN